ncbi:MAG: YbjQ family protein [Fibrobacter sp.]|nr:YbjQ family protein [Fibrobacter sp.]MCQ2123743.1 YbjQ family protein [Fibrobacter sp.]
MKLYTTDFISGKEIETIQMVKGSIVFSKNVVRDVFAGLKSIIGGELAGYTEMLEQARQEATNRMVIQAQNIGADAIVSVRFMTSAVMAGAAEIIVYGTAVKFKK